MADNSSGQASQRGCTFCLPLRLSSPSSSPADIETSIAQGRSVPSSLCRDRDYSSVQTPGNWVVRKDFLSHLAAARDDEGKPLGEQELTAEALSLIVAGSDTTSSSIGIVTYHVARNKNMQARLQKELDDVLGVPNSTFGADEVVAPFDLVKNLTYLQDVINEGLRLHSTIACSASGSTTETYLGERRTKGPIKTWAMTRNDDVPLYAFEASQKLEKLASRGPGYPIKQFLSTRKGMAHATSRTAAGSTAMDLRSSWGSRR
ncbi:uncharacterized protein PHACADRAFT_187295 [Phanerochaete carnosa HHB-10118-sp]|uniref:Cytochrome P450 n=1 Tax=Phanerochaete carnosa (strain HHB-10118-sp) TaxID=650164 RepID=K5UQ14_PHACS|nr:uncharacterized protein PHACADRAFT_187295 [Phanerochaete carnosa HHB-10118-sp]EKM51906.1 hypothetical protein PHACADRAFT_187295 [Phanerochaete carnosa HHB-10118-sp]